MIAFATHITNKSYYHLFIFINCETRIFQILRSLYDGSGQESSTTDTGGTNKEEDTNTDDKQKDHDAPSSTNNSEASGNSHMNVIENDSTVSNDVWNLIEQYLHRRHDYLPHKQLQSHWTNINNEAKSRIEYISSTSQFIEEEEKPSSRGRSSVTPRGSTPMFSIMGRGSLAPTSLHLTPQSSNKNKSTSNELIQNDIELASSIPSWNLINSMLGRRKELCTESCESFRTQPFLTKVHDEATKRCKSLEGLLQSMKMGVGSNSKRRINDNKKREGSRGEANHVGKRQKWISSRPSLLGSFLNDHCSDEVKVANIGGNATEQTCNEEEEGNDDEDSIMKAKMKLVLWSALLKSVKEITDES